jgi:propanol-preferring alcohol dehydrogenase
VDGTFQQYCVANAAHVARLAKDIPLDEIAPILCAGITVYKGLKESGAKPGQTVAIVGAGGEILDILRYEFVANQTEGGLGSLAQQYAKAMGLQVVAIDTGADKRDMSLNDLGASAFVDFKESKDVVADVRAAANNGEGPHAVVLVAVSEKPFHQISLLVRPRIDDTDSFLTLLNTFARGEQSSPLACPLTPI